LYLKFAAAERLFLCPHSSGFFIGEIMAEVIDFESKRPQKPELITDKDFLQTCINLILEETEYEEVVITGLNQDSNTDVTSSETGSRTLDLLEQSMSTVIRDLIK
jgi:hypothetical protein